MDLPGNGGSRDLVKCPRALPQFSELRSMPTAAAAAAIAAIAAADGRSVHSQGMQATVQAVTNPQETPVSIYFAFLYLPFFSSFFSSCCLSCFAI